MRELGVSNHLPDRLEGKKRGRRGKIVVALVVLFASILPSVLVNAWFLMVGVGVFFILLSSAFSPGSEEKALRAGIWGEDVLKKKLREILSDEYIALFNLPLARGDIDCFLVGPTGVYVFDVKNHRGSILYCNGKWTQIKMGRGGGVYKGDHMKDPSFQIRKGVYQIKNYLQKKGINLWVNGVIVFTNPETKVYSEEMKDIKILKIDEIESFFEKNKVRIDPTTVETIAGLVYEEFRQGKQ